MSKKKSVPHEEGLSDVRVDIVKVKERKRTPHADYEGVKEVQRKVQNRQTDFVYVNSAYVGSLNSVNDGILHQPPTTVIREQYWTCSRWSFAKRVLAIAAGLILGASIGLAVTMAIKGQRADEVIGDIFRSSAPD